MNSNDCDGCPTCTWDDYGPQCKVPCPACGTAEYPAATFELDDEANQEIDATTEYLNPCASAVCPHCGETFYTLPRHDPLKHHVQYCEKRPHDEDGD